MANKRPMLTIIAGQCEWTMLMPMLITIDDGQY